MVKIALDAGHGYNTLGKRCMKSLDSNQTREWWLNDRIVDRLERLLKNYECEVIRVDDTTGMKDVLLSSRVKKANNDGADMYISVHHNAGLSGRKGGGTVMYYYSSNGLRKIQATKLYNEIVNRTGLVGNRSSKVINNGFYVLKNTKMAAFLLENGFMDSPDDVPVILSAEHSEKTAQGILAFLVSEFKLKKVSSVDQQPTTTTTYTKKDFVKEVQSAIGAKVDGIPGQETLGKTLTISRTKNNRHAVVKPVQKYLNSLGYDCGVADGIAGVKFDSAVKAFQKANGCVADGELTAKGRSWMRLLGL